MTVEHVLTAVPLLKLSEYSDDIVIGSLGLPVGFDESRLLVNVAAFNRVRTAGGIGRISITGSAGKQPDTMPSITGIDASGTATASTGSRMHDRPLSNGVVRFPSPSTLYDRPDAVLNIDTTMVEARLADRKNGMTEVRSPFARSKVLNSAVKSGLTDAVRAANFDETKVKVSGRLYGAFVGLRYVTTGDVTATLQSLHYLVPIVTTMALASTGRAAITAGQPPMETLARLRKSILYGCTPDRYVAAAAIIQTHRFIRPSYASS